MRKSVLDKQQKLYLCSVFVFLLGAIAGLMLMFIGESKTEYNTMAIGVMTIWRFNLAFCCFKLKERIVAFLFHLTMFLFLMSRFIIALGRGNIWWTIYSTEANRIALYAIAFALISIVIGVIAFEIVSFYISRLQEKKHANAKESNKVFGINIDALRFVVRIALIVCFVCFFIRELDKLDFMSGRSYTDYYTAYTSRVPFMILFPAGCMPFLLCLLLALKPSKKEAFIWLAIYVISALPMLKIGARNPIMLNCVFAFVYYCLRSIHGKSWFGKFEKTVIIIAIPVFILFFGYYNYIRDDKEIELSPINTVIDFAYKQGTTYDTILQGYLYQDKLFGRDEKLYSFGAITDNILYNSLGKLIFDAPDIGTGNCLKAAYNSHSLAHGISYVVLESDYIRGLGRGTSYIIESYLDFGFVGVAIFSLLIGCVCAACVLLFNKKWFGSVVILNILLNIFFVARSETLSFIVFLFSYKFWIVLFGVLFIAWIADRLLEKYHLRKYKLIKTVLEF